MRLATRASVNYPIVLINIIVLIELVNSSGVLRSFTGNMATIYLSEKDKSILPLEWRTPFTGPEPTADSAGFCISQLP